MIRNILKLKRGCRFFVQEVGIAGKNRMKKRAAFLRPNTAVITNIGQDHYKSFRTLEATAAEKGLLVEALPKTGVAVLNADDPHVAAMESRTKARVLTYGMGEGADVRAMDVEGDWPQRLSLTVAYQGNSVRIQTGLFGDLQVTSILAATAAALGAGLNLNQCAQSLTNIEAYDRRMSLHQTRNGIWFVNDTFKAPFWGIPKVLAQLEYARAPRKTVVFGSFSDTAGACSPKYRAMARAALAYCDRVIFVGEKSGYVRKLFSLENEGRLFAFDELQEALSLLKETALKDELVLVKSNGLEHLERLIYGQDKDLNCWINPCSKLCDCRNCEQSGWA